MMNPNITPSLSEKAQKLDPNFGGFRLEGGHYGHYNGHWGVGLRAYDKTAISGIADRKLVVNRGDLFHIGRLIYFEPAGYHFKVYPVVYSANKKGLVLVTDREKRVITYEEALHKLGFIIGNHLTGSKPGVMMQTEDVMPVIFIKLDPGDAFAVPYTGFVVRLDESPAPGSKFTLDTKGKYTLYKSPEPNKYELGQIIHIDGKVMWMLYAPRKVV